MEYDLDWDYFQENYFLPLVNVATINKCLSLRFSLLIWFFWLVVEGDY